MIRNTRNPAVQSRDGRPKGARRVLRRLWIAAVAIGLVGPVGCEDPPLEYDRVIGIIDFDHPDWRLPVIPDTATAAVPFEIIVWTGGNSCHRGGDTEVSAWDRTALVIPFDYRIAPRPGGNDPGCFPELSMFRHAATLVFEEPGTAEIVLVYSTDRKAYLPEHYKGDGRKVYTVEVAEAGSG